MTLAETFDQIYRTNRWSGGESRSGRGAGIAERDGLAPDIVALVKRLGVTSVLDIGCGEGFWMPDLPGYIGIDVSTEAVSAYLVRHPERDIRLDRGEPYPRADMVILRTVLQHLSFRTGIDVLDRIRASGATWLLATTYDKGKNKDVIDGDGYWVDMRVAPFSLGEPIERLLDGRTDSYDNGCWLALWRLV